MLAGWPSWRACASRSLRCVRTITASVLAPLIAGGFVVNLSVDVSSVALIRLCRELNALYIDTCIEPWAGGYVDAGVPLAQRTNYALREEVRKIRGGGPTAVVAHGANPGMVSHLFKSALVRLAADMGHTVAPATREDWANLAMQLGVKGIHIAERDTQWADVPRWRTSSSIPGRSRDS